MTEEKKKLLSEDNLRHSEYYGLQGVFDELYAKSKNGEELTDLMPLILSRENILLAYRNIKTNTGWTYVNMVDTKTWKKDHDKIRELLKIPII